MSATRVEYGHTSQETIAGTTELDKHVAESLKSSQIQFYFISLSVDMDSGSEYLDTTSLHAYIEKYFDHLSVSEFYGYSCSTKAKSANSSEHMVKCPSHPEFLLHEPLRERHPTQVKPLTNEVHEMACCHFLTQISYFNVEGYLLHDECRVPFLWVMMIAPSKDSEDERKVYQRLGIGKVFMKRWLESSPVSETLVLE
jgi:hypothetical protein